MDKVKYLGGAVLAYVGDAYLELLVREKLAESPYSDTGVLSMMAKKIVCAKKQSELTNTLLENLDENEQDVFKLGKNYKVSSKPKHSTMMEYHKASGFEAVFGYWHLSGNDEKAREVFEKIYGDEILKVIEEGRNG